MKKCAKISTVIIFALIFTFISVTTLSLAAPASLHLDIFADPTGDVEPGDALTLTYQLFNSDVGTRSVLFYAAVPEGTEFRSVVGAAPLTYTLGLRVAYTGTGTLTGTGSLPPGDVKAIYWQGDLDALRYVTMTVEVLGGSDNIIASAALVDNQTHQVVMTATETVNRPHYAFIPMITRDWYSGWSGGSLQLPLEITPSIVVGLHSNGPDYPTAMQGYNLTAGSSQINVGQEYIFNWWNIYRSYIEFDTRQVRPGQVRTATFHLKILGKRGGDPTASIYAGTWNNSPLSREELYDYRTDLTFLWNAYTPPALATIFQNLPPGDVEYVYNPVPITVTIPIAAITPGGYTRFVVRGNFEGATSPEILVSAVGTDVVLRLE